MIVTTVIIILVVVFAIVCIGAFVYGAGRRIYQAIQSGELSDENIEHIAERRFNEREPELRRQYETKYREKYNKLFDFLPRDVEEAQMEENHENEETDENKPDEETTATTKRKE